MFAPGQPLGGPAPDDQNKTAVRFQFEPATAAGRATITSNEVRARTMSTGTTPAVSGYMIREDHDGEQW